MWVGNVISRGGVHEGTNRAAVFGGAPLASPIVGDKPFGYAIVVQPPGGPGNSRWLGQVQQTMDGTASDS